MLLEQSHSSIGWLTGSGIFNSMLHVQIQVQELPVATSMMIVF